MLGDQDIAIGLYASIIAASVSTAGVLVMAVFGRWAEKNSSYFSALAVGLLTVAVLLHLIPEAIDESPMAITWVAVGFAVMVLVGMAVQVSFRRRPDGAALTFGYASIIALSAHSAIDGVIYAVAFQEEAFTGWLATAGLLFHEFPEGVIAFLLLIEAGVNRLRAMLTAIFAAAVTTVAGAMAAYIALDYLTELPVAEMLAGAAGALIYILIVHLVPHAAKTPGGRGYDVAALGVIIGTIAVIIEVMGGGGHHH